MLKYHVQRGLLAISTVSCQCQSSRGFYNLIKKGINRDAVAWLNQPVDFSLTGILRWWKEKAEKALVDEHRFSVERYETLGPDLATAHFVVERNGAVKFEGSDRWLSKKSDHSLLPTVPSRDIRLEAVDMSDTELMYVSLDNFTSLSSLKYLSVAGCRYIDDWCLDRFIQFRDSLVVLDVSRCPMVTERGLATLHKLRRLQRLRMYDMPAVTDKKLVALLLEEALPAGCVVEGVDFNAAEDESTENTLPTFFQCYENIAVAEQQARAALQEYDSQIIASDTSSPSTSTKQDGNDKLLEEKKVSS